MSDYQLVADDRTVEGWYNGEEPAVSNGYGGWGTTTRPQKASLTSWQGREPFQISLPMMLDERGDSVEDAIHDLEVLASGNSVESIPSLVRPRGMLMLPTHAGRDWLINDLAWGDRLRRRGDRAVIRQHVTVSLLEEVTDKLLAASTTQTRRNGRAVVRHYKVKAGDTLHSIASRELGDPKRWADIAALNDLRSSGQLHVGQTLRLP